MTEKFDDYIVRMLASDEVYGWNQKRYDSMVEKRSIFQTKYPHIITRQGHYGYFGEADLSIIEEWCREKFSDMNGPCHWSKCPESFDFWYDNSGWEEILDKELKDIDFRIDDDKANKRASAMAIDRHYDMIDKLPDAPRDPDGNEQYRHSHSGTWNTLWLDKTGYDYGYQDFGFMHKGDAIQFKMHWGENG